MRRALLACVLVAVVGLGACSGGADLDGEVVLAVAVPTTGDLADFGRTIADGVRLAAQEQNDAGGLLGREVVVDVFDDEASDEVAATVATEVVASGAPAVIGHFNSGASLAAAEIYAGADVLQITPTSTNVRLTQLGIDTFFRTSANDATQGPALADEMIADGRTRPAVLFAAENAYAEGLAASTVDALVVAGVRLVAEESFGPRTRDWAPQLEAIAGADPDSLLLIAEAPQAAEILVQARELGIELPTYGGDSLAKQEFLLKAGSAADGTTITSLLPNIVSGPDADTELVETYRDEFGRNPGIDTPAGSVAAETWFMGVEAAGTFEAGPVADALKSGFSWDSPIGEIAYDDAGDLVDQRIYTSVVEDETFVPK